VNLDGFSLSHTSQVVEPLEDAEAKVFVGPFRAVHPLLDVDKPVTWGAFAMPDYYFELKRAQQAAMEEVPSVFLDVQTEFAKVSGRSYAGFVEKYRLDDADRALVVLGSTAGTAKVAVDALRARGEKVGLLKVWLYRPFPYREVASALENVKHVGVLDRALSFGAMGALYTDVATSLLRSPARPAVHNYIYGLGGRDITADQLQEVLLGLGKRPDGGLRYIGLRE
jgi:pyruvate ferredoxin oxidoreductase alpha subunit